MENLHLIKIIYARTISIKKIPKGNQPVKHPALIVWQPRQHLGFWREKHTIFLFLQEF